MRRLPQRAHLHVSRLRRRREERIETWKAEAEALATTAGSDNVWSGNDRVRAAAAEEIDSDMADVQQVGIVLGAHRKLCSNRKDRNGRGRTWLCFHAARGEVRPS